MWRHVDKGTPEGAIDAMLIHGQGKENMQTVCWGQQLACTWDLNHTLDHELNLPELVALLICSGMQVLCSSPFLNFLGRCHHCVQCWAHSAFLGDQHWGIELGDVPGHWQVGFPLCTVSFPLQCWSRKEERGWSPCLGLHYREKSARRKVSEITFSSVPKECLNLAAKSITVSIS